MIRKALFIGGLLSIAALLGCGAAQYALVGSAHVAGAYGEVQIERASEGRIMVTVIMDELPPPSELELTTYVLWFAPEGGSPENQGALTYEDKTRRAKITASTPHRTFSLMVTAEESADAAEPGDLVITRQQIQER